MAMEPFFRWPRLKAAELGVGSGCTSGCVVVAVAGGEDVILGGDGED
jgi:hypothetical protein